ncbi:Tat pathway signal sequence [Mediterraneibacter sp. NSJ-55]|uniref:Tat pathway signal sequence n=1 Tax=Mediterraneibacter hominis TaxID=2763054 RepID=A0A923LL28_9FIRM|nr:Tat pathway signal sequence [Mediterraneibacter hominis]MBC5689916.1 Tat pathway signal sequence [Mediterraneibacter hominis]
MKYKRMSASLVGIILCGVSIAMARIADLGTDPFTILCTGIGKWTGLPFGVSFLCMSSLGLLFALFLKRGLLGIATIVNLCGTGFVADFAGNIIERIKAMPNMLGEKMLLAGCAFLLLCFAAAVYMSADMGVSGYDAIAMSIAVRTGKTFRVCRIFSDVLCVLAGYTLGGKIGIYTVLTAGFMGPFIQFFRERIVDIWMWGE